MLSTKAVAYLVGYGGRIAHSPSTTLLILVDGTAKLRHAVASVSGRADEDTKVVQVGIAEHLIDDFLALEQPRLVVGIGVKVQTMVSKTEKDEVVVANNLKFDTYRIVVDTVQVFL